jgi:hypothetical protein
MSKVEKRIISINSCIFSPNFLDVRAELPSRDLSMVDGVDLKIFNNNIDISNFSGFEGPKIVIVQRPRVLDRKAWLKAAAAIYKADCVFIYEIDDHPDLLVKVNGTHEIDLLIKSVCAVQTSTAPLQEYFKEKNQNVIYFGNSCHNLPIFTRKHADKAKVFYGALNRGEYSARIAELVSDAIKKHDAEVHVVADREFFSSLKVEKKLYHEPMSYRNYLNLMGKCDILLSPLDNRPGERYKSDVKYIEASAMGLVTIASSLVYGETIADGVTGIIANSEKDWSGALDWLLSNPGGRQKIAYSAWDYVRRERLFSEQAPLRLQWYLDLWRKRDVLWSEVFERVPELRDYL